MKRPTLKKLIKLRATFEAHLQFGNGDRWFEAVKYIDRLTDKIEISA